MYTCEQCRELIGPGVPSHRVVTALRPREYPARFERKDPGGAGWEIVREATACPACAARHVPPAAPPRERARRAVSGEALWRARALDQSARGRAASQREASTVASAPAV